MRANVEAIHLIVDDRDDLEDDNTVLGLVLHKQFDRTLAPCRSLARHSGADPGEAYQSEGEYVVERLSA